MESSPSSQLCWLTKISSSSNNCQHLSANNQEKLLQLLVRFESLFDGTLGDWRTKPVSFQLKEGVSPYHGRAFPVPKIHKDVLIKEIERLCKLGVLEWQHYSEWASPSFIVPKKNGTVRFLSDFREVNKRLIRKPFPIPKISTVLQELEGFTFATALDLNMGYYTIRLDPDASKICTIIFPWGKYSYKRLPMGIAGSPDIFQAKMTLWNHCWGCKPPHSASHIHNTCIWSVWAPSYGVERHLGAPLHSYINDLY